tara:strand:+ start:11334 stop:12548 length:1215 start_codon:yes stop_codon:yes gene_type:complete
LVGRKLLERIAIVSGVRTPVGRFGGSLKNVQASSLAASVLRECIRRANIDAGEVDEVIMGHVLVNGETPNVARIALLEAGFPVSVPAYSLDRQCGSGLQSVLNGAMQISTGQASIVLAGGVESESNAEYYLAGARWGLRFGSRDLKDRLQGTDTMVSCPSHYSDVGGMLDTAERLANQYRISRQRQDEFALLSHQKAVSAVANGIFTDEILPISKDETGEEEGVLSRDEHPRPDTSIEKLASLKPLRQGGTVTAGNASGINDGAAAVLLMTETMAKDRGLEPLGYVGQWSVVGTHPGVMGIGPAVAIRDLLGKARRSLEDVSLIELNEAFAAQALAVLDELDVYDYSNVNVNGSGISLGHPLGATGARILVSLVYEMRRRDSKIAIESMCIGGGMGLAAFIERD